MKDHPLYRQNSTIGAVSHIVIVQHKQSPARVWQTWNCQKTLPTAAALLVSVFNLPQGALVPHLKRIQFEQYKVYSHVNSTCESVGTAVI